MSEFRAARLLLAGSAGHRYGMPKALVVIDGRRLVERGLATLRETTCDPSSWCWALRSRCVPVPACPARR
ncbi:NTP transferase domain-containing protein [Micromonospora sp. DT201]|uniref:NTP transferase domain-containing protein n=1 Tax=Micromonospora sp. DT201 TaxID=3393442 RepID=UPI003CEDD38E